MPRTDSKLKEIWSTVLNIPEEEISSNSNFLDFGGDSIKLQLLTLLVEKQFKVRIPFDEIHNFLTFVDMNNYIDNVI